MKITEIKVSMGRTVDIRPYYSRRFDLCVTAELADGDEYEACRQELLNELNQKLNEIELAARAEASQPPVQPKAKAAPQAPSYAQPPVQQNSPDAYEEEARRSIADLLASIPRGSNPTLSKPVADRLEASLQRHGWQGLDDVKGVASLLLNRRIKEVWDVREHEAKAITLWLDKASDSLLDALWPPAKGA